MLASQGEFLKSTSGSQLYYNPWKFWDKTNNLNMFSGFKYCSCCLLIGNFHFFLFYYLSKGLNLFGFCFVHLSNEDNYTFRGWLLQGLKVIMHIKRVYSRSSINIFQHDAHIYQRWVWVSFSFITQFLPIDSMQCRWRRILFIQVAWNKSRINNRLCSPNFW